MLQPEDRASSQHAQSQADVAGDVPRSGTKVGCRGRVGLKYAVLLERPSSMAAISRGLRDTDLGSLENVSGICMNPQLPCCVLQLTSIDSQYSVDNASDDDEYVSTIAPEPTGLQTPM